MTIPRELAGSTLGSRELAAVFALTPSLFSNLGVVLSTSW